MLFFFVLVGGGGGGGGLVHVQCSNSQGCEGGIMHKPMASALSTRDRYYIAQVH